MKKKFAAMFMAAAMVFTMAACGQKADTPSTPDADGAPATSPARRSRPSCSAPAAR